MLRLDQLSLSFSRYQGFLTRTQQSCLSGISFDIRAGEIVAVLGASGAGKSLLAHAIVGLLPSNASVGGQILFRGETLDPARQARLRGREIALVPQSIAYLDPLARIGRQVAWAARRCGIPSGESGAIARHSLLAYGLDDSVLELFPHQLSGGMARRVLLAMATVANPSLIIADEPTSGLDGENISIAMSHLRAQADQGRGVMLITHDIPAALGVADRVVIIRDGRTHEIASPTAFSGKADQLKTGYARRLWNALPANDFETSVA